MKKVPVKLKFFLLNLLIALILVCGIATYILYRLDNYTQHGSSIAVPSFYGLNLQESDAVASHTGLRVQVIDSLYDEDARPGTVVEQYPAEESRVKENRLIHLIINAQNPEKIAFPKLQNAAYRQTLQTLEAKGFTIGHIAYVPSEFKNLVLSLKNNGETILPGTLLSKGAVIDLELGSGEGSNTVFVPQLTGKKLDEVISLIRKNYLNPGEIVPDGSITKATDKRSAFIYQQFPEPNQSVEAGSIVNLYITLKKDKLPPLDSLMVSE